MAKPNKKNNNQKKPYNGHNSKRPINNFKEAKKYVKFDPITYKKSFDDFETAVKEMIDSNPVISRILENAESITPEVVSREMLKEFEAKYPVIGTPTQIVSILLSSSRCTLKTNEFIAFGYKFKYTKDGEEVKLTDIEAEITLYRENDFTDDFLTMSGWNKK